MVVRQCGVRARADDGLEGDVVGALLVDRAHDPPGNVRLRGPDHALAGEAREDRVDDLRGASDRFELGRLLDRAQHHRHGRDRHELDSRREQVGVPRDRDVVGLEGDRRVRESSELRRDSGQEVALDDLGLDLLDRPGGFRIAPVGHQHDALAFHEHKGIRALEPGQVADVHRVGDEERCDIEPLHLCAQALDPAVHDLRFPLCARNTRAS
jgi:hypothetical protein